jgi:hypothetical protein
MEKHKPDAILTSMDDLPSMLAEAGYSVPRDVGLATMNVLDGGCDAGINQNPEEIGRVAMLVLMSLIHDGARGVPKIFRQILIEVVCDAFKSYRQWLYKEKLRPLIEGAVNELLVGICDGRPLFLEGEWLNTIDTFAWFLRDGTSRPIIEKASGFQRFIVGMAMRIAMSRLGICKVVYEQLFIDEGFTACDGPNLEKTPAFLRGLLNSSGSSGRCENDRYKSIVLATHLEELKTCGNIQISIKRDPISGISNIKMGQMLEVAKESAKGRRGKPPANLSLTLSQ